MLPRSTKGRYGKDLRRLDARCIAVLEPHSSLETSILLQRVTMMMLVHLYLATAVTASQLFLIPDAR